MDKERPPDRKPILVYLINGATWGVGFGVALMTWNALSYFWGVAGPQLQLQQQGFQAMSDAVSKLNQPRQASKFCTEITQGPPKGHAECTTMRDQVVESVYRRCRLGYSLKASFEE